MVHQNGLRLFYGVLKLIQAVTRRVQQHDPQDFDQHRLEPSALLWPELEQHFLHTSPPCADEQLLAFSVAGSFTST